MESKTKKGTNTKPKTKAQIDAAHPFIKPENCPGAVMDWVVQRDEKRDEREALRDRALIALIEETIDKLFEKHFKKYVTMIFTNRILSVVALVGLGLLFLFVLYQVSMHTI